MSDERKPGQAMIEEPTATRRETATRFSESTIGELASFYGLSLRTLRFYEQKGLLRPRRQGTARFYSAKDRIRLELVLKGKRLGFTLAEILDLIESRAKSMPEEVSADLTVSLERSQIAAQIDHLEGQRRQLDAAIEELRRAYNELSEATIGVDADL